MSLKLSDGCLLTDLENGDKVRCINKSSKHFGKVFEVYGAENDVRYIKEGHNLTWRLKLQLYEFEKVHEFKDIEELFEI